MNKKFKNADNGGKLRSTGIGAAIVRIAVI
jgi:hypothetical protein